MNPNSNREIIIGSKTVHSREGKRIFAITGRVILLYSWNYAGDVGSSAEHEAGNKEGKRLKVHGLNVDHSKLMDSFYSYLAFVPYMYILKLASKME